MKRILKMAVASSKSFRPMNITANAGFDFLGQRQGGRTKHEDGNAALSHLRLTMMVVK